MESNHEDVVALEVCGEPIGRASGLGLKCAKESIPDDEDATVVSVQVLRIGAMVNSVMGWGHKDELIAAHSVDELGVQPILIEKIYHL